MMTRRKWKQWSSYFLFFLHLMMIDVFVQIKEEKKMTTFDFLFEFIRVERMDSEFLPFRLTDKLKRLMFHDKRLILTVVYLHWFYIRHRVHVNIRLFDRELNSTIDRNLNDLKTSLRNENEEENILVEPFRNPLHSRPPLNLTRIRLSMYLFKSTIFSFLRPMLSAIWRKKNDEDDTIIIDLFLFCCCFFFLFGQIFFLFHDDQTKEISEQLRQKTRFLRHKLIRNWFDQLWFVRSRSNKMLFSWSFRLNSSLTKTIRRRQKHQSRFTCRLILDNGTCFPDSFAARFNCSFNLTRVRKSDRHFECLTKQNGNFTLKFANRVIYCVQYGHWFV